MKIFWKASIIQMAESDIHKVECGADDDRAPHFTQNMSHSASCKMELSKKISWDPPFSKMPKMKHFSELGNGRLRYVRSKVSGAEPLSLKCLLWPSFQVTFNDVTVTVGPQRHSNCCGKKHFFKPILEAKFGK